MAKKAQEKIDFETGEILSEQSQLNKIVEVVTKRPNGTIRIQQDFSNCPTLAEQHTAHLSNINYLMERYKPDELAQYLAARNQYRQEILGHDFSSEPNLQEASNVIYRSRQEFLALPDEVRNQFANHLEFLKFIDNPANVDKMLRLGILTPRQVESIQIPEPGHDSPTQTRTQDEDKAKKQ